MRIEVKTARGIEVTRDGRPVSGEEIRNRGLLAVGRNLLAERAADQRMGRRSRALNAIEREALDVASRAGLRPGASAPRQADGAARLASARAAHMRDLRAVQRRDQDAAPRTSLDPRAVHGRDVRAVHERDMREGEALSRRLRRRGLLR